MFSVTINLEVMSNEVMRTRNIMKLLEGNMKWKEVIQRKQKLMALK